MDLAIFKASFDEIIFSSETKLPKLFILFIYSASKLIDLGTLKIDPYKHVVEFWDSILSTSISKCLFSQISISFSSFLEEGKKHVKLVEFVKHNTYNLEYWAV